MFSTIPRIGTRVCWNMRSVFMEIRSPTSCGVETITCTSQGNGLGQGQLNISGAGRQIDDEIVQVAPVDVEQALLQRLGGHWPAPDQRLVRLHEQPHRHELQAGSLRGFDSIAD